MKKNYTNEELDRLNKVTGSPKNNRIGFRAAFKATLGFYAAQIVISILGWGAILGVLIFLHWVMSK